MEVKAAPGRQIIERYGKGRFRVGGVEHQGSVLVFPDRTMSWPVVSFDQVGESAFEAVFAHGALDVLLLGCGGRMAMPPAALKAAFKVRRIALEPMDTGAACRTYNLLATEERRVAAALIAIE
jgi:uncharacterized protein